MVCPCVCPVDFGKTAERISMRFGMVGRTGPGMRQAVGFVDRSTGRVILGANIGRPVVTSGNVLLPSQTVDLENFATASRSSLHVINKARQ